MKESISRLRFEDFSNFSITWTNNISLFSAIYWKYSVMNRITHALFARKNASSYLSHKYTRVTMTYNSTCTIRQYRSRVWGTESEEKNILKTTTKKIDRTCFVLSSSSIWFCKIIENFMKTFHKRFSKRFLTERNLTILDYYETN